MTSTTIDIAIAAWKAATTQADRDLAAEAIEQHIADETPEGADYESATEELLARLKAEFGSIPVEDIRQLASTSVVRYFIALPAEQSCQTAIFGIGHTEEEAIADAYDDSRTRAPTVEAVNLPSRHVDGETEEAWVVTTWEGRETFYSEAEADQHVLENAFVAEECTERLFVSLQRGSVDRWTTNAARLQDLDLDEGAIEDALNEVKEGLDSEHASTIAALKPEEALSDAHAYVDAFVGQNEDSEYSDAVGEDREFRLALDLAVRDHLLELIAEREAA